MRSSFASALFLVLTAGLAAQWQGPATTFAVLYTGEDFTGWSYRVLPGDEIPDFERLQDGRWAFLDREVNSVEVHGSMHLVGFERSEYRGARVVIEASVPRLRDYRPPFTGARQDGNDDWDWSERIASLTVHEGAAPHDTVSGPRHYGGHAVIFYEDADFEGSSFGFDDPQEIRRLGDFAMGHLNWNDQISSIEIRAPCQVTLYKGGNFNGAPLVLTESARNLTNVRNPYGRVESWNDDISSIRIERLPPPGLPPLPPPPNQPPDLPGEPVAVATLYAKPSYEGDALPLFPGQEIPQLGEVGWNDRITSLRVAPGHVVVLYADGNYKGRSVRITSDHTNLGGSDWADRASSLRVEEAR